MWRTSRSNTVLTLWAVLALLAMTGFVALGTWQVKRLAWKLDLIERVDQRVHAAAVNAPGPEQWSQVDAATAEYRHVRIKGVFLHERETLVQASTALGAGFWVMTPLQTADNSIVLVNRGFVPPEGRDRITRVRLEPLDAVTVTGLLRLSEPGGGFMRRNDPAGHHWFSRDVQAIAKARGLTNPTAPYFIDADAASAVLPHQAATNTSDPVWPVGGLTVVSFANNHLVYAITWFALALMVAAGAAYVWREERKSRRNMGWQKR